MNYMTYYPVDLVNGPGIRSTLFVSGCSFACKGCYNETAWNPKSGSEFTKDVEDRIIADLQCTRVNRKGLSILGGDPLHNRNLESVFELVRRVRRECPSKDIWLWSGFTLEEVFGEEFYLRQNLVSCVDVFIDGRFELENKSVNHRYRGSSNQRIWKNVDGKFEEVVL